MRRFGEPVDPARRYRTRQGAYAVILEGRDVLLTVQTGSEREVQLPGGALDPGEGALRALHRESLEETGWRIRVERRLGAFQRFTFMPEYDVWAQKVCHVYLARPVHRLGPPAEPDQEAVWMPVETAAVKAAVEGDRHYLALVARGLRSGAAAPSSAVPRVMISGQARIKDRPLTSSRRLGTLEPIR